MKAKFIDILEQIKASPVPNDLDAVKFGRELVFLRSQFETAAEYAQKGLNTCSPESVISCLRLVVLSKYLTFDKKQNNSFAVPYGGVLQISLGYSAYVAALNGNGIKMTVGEIYKGEKYAIEYTDNGYKLSHQKTVFDSSQNPIIYFCTSRDPDGYSQLVAMDAAEIEKRKACAKTQTIWAKWHKEMAQKTVLLRLCNMYYRHLLSDILGADIDNDYSENNENSQIATPKAPELQAPKMETMGLPVMTDEEIAALKIKLEACTDVKELGVLYKQNELHAGYTELFSNRKREILDAEITKEDEMAEAFKMSADDYLALIKGASSLKILQNVIENIEADDNFGTDSTILNGVFFKAIEDKKNYFTIENFKRTIPKK
jgi:recombinational DNA repair protein RecT